MATNLITIKPEEMQYDYYSINPRQHSEAAYQPKQGDKFPPTHSIPTTAGRSGYVIVMVTHLYNKNTGARAEMQLVDYDSLKKYNGGVFPTPEQAQKIIQEHPQMVAGQPAGATPFLAKIYCEPNSRVTVRPLTGGTQVKAVSAEDYQAANGRPPF
ncbi:MAG TPA: hypothetical protein VNA19_14415 [Pyrinomonadaceae bacterium]|jgi:hypothetical protein|nr:hypothetical protein [Pyrinomonadaceae bacterium]